MLKSVASFMGAFFVAVIVGLALGKFIPPHKFTDQNDAAAVVMVHAGSGHGSGVYIGAKKFLTAAHVVADIGVGGKVTLISAKNPEDKVEATILWIDVKRDVAVVIIDRIVKLPAAKLVCDGRPDAAVGTEVHSIGYPLDLGLVETWGKIASLPRDNKSGTGSGKLTTVDLMGAPGNSGGPVFDNFGYVVGLVDAFPTITSMMGIIAFPNLIQIIPRTEICAAMHGPHAPLPALSVKPAIPAPPFNTTPSNVAKEEHK